jgi:hypothetical protein
VSYNKPEEKLIWEAYVKEDNFEDMMPDTYEKGQGAHDDEHKTRELQRISHRDREEVDTDRIENTEIEDMSDGELVDLAHQVGAEDFISFDMDGGIANRDELINAIGSGSDDDVNFDSVKVPYDGVSNPDYRVGAQQGRGHLGRAQARPKKLVSVQQEAGSAVDQRHGAKDPDYKAKVAASKKLQGIDDYEPDNSAPYYAFHADQDKKERENKPKRRKGIKVKASSSWRDAHENEEDVKEEDTDWINRGKSDEDKEKRKKWLKDRGQPTEDEKPKLPPPPPKEEGCGCAVVPPGEKEEPKSGSVKVIKSKGLPGKLVKKIVKSLHGGGESGISLG